MNPTKQQLKEAQTRIEILEDKIRCLNTDIIGLKCTLNKTMSEHDRENKATANLRQAFRVTANVLSQVAQVTEHLI